jgi:Histone methylation protein DOT1
VSTLIHQSPPQCELDRFHELRRLLDRASYARHLLQPEQLAMRLNALDELDALIGDLDPDVWKTCSDSELLARAMVLRSEFEAANQSLYAVAHSEIASCGDSPTLSCWLQSLTEDGQRERPRSGLSFDLLDEIVCGVFQFRGPEEINLLPSPEMTAYQPTPVRHIVDLIASCSFSSDDIFVDLGSGLGHVPLLVRILTGVRTVGIEVQLHHAESAQQTAERLNLSRIRFIAEDARVTDLSIGTVFYMFTPFIGTILAEVLDRLSRESQRRRIKICALGPCARILHEQTWLKANRRPDVDRVTVFQSL